MVKLLLKSMWNTEYSFHSCVYCVDSLSHYVYNKSQNSEKYTLKIPTDQIKLLVLSDQQFKMYKYLLLYHIKHWNTANSELWEAEQVYGKFAWQLIAGFLNNPFILTFTD